MPYLALQGIRVVELATNIAGPYCGRMLAEYGAEVIKIESPQGDPSRLTGPLIDGELDPEKSALYLHLNRNKKSVVLDLEKPDDRESLRRLISQSHAVIESFKPGVMDSFGLGYADLSESNPGLVMTSITPYGQSGPYKDYDFTELTLFAHGGPMHREGMEEREPLKYGGNIGQYFSGTAAAASTMGALVKASAHGVGDWIDLSMQECVAGHPHQIGRRLPFAYGGELDPRTYPFDSTSQRDNYGSGTYKCKDGFVSFLPLGARMFPNFCGMIDHPEMATDARFSTPAARRENYATIRSTFQSWLNINTRMEVFAKSQEARLPGGPVLLVNEVMNDKHFNGRNFFEEIEHPTAGTLTYPGHQFKMSVIGETSSTPAPLLGQHTEEVLNTLNKQQFNSAAGFKPASTIAEKSADLPLKGIRVLEFGEVWAGPFCGTALADMGAEVIKVESISRMGRGPIRPADDAPGYPYDGPGERPWNRFGNFNAVNRNKKSITLDLADPAGVETLKELVAASDVVFSNYVFGVLDKFGLGYDQLRKVRPDLVMVLMPGYGIEGPYSRFRSMGVTIDAITGHSFFRGYPDLDQTHNSLVHHPDAVAALTGAFAISSALHYRTRTGKGQLIDMAQSEAFINHLGEMYIEYGLTGEVRERQGNRHPQMAPQGAYQCVGDDSWVALSVRTDSEWNAFCDALAIPELSGDPCFANLEARSKNHDELDTIITNWTSGRDRYDIAELLQSKGIPASPVLGCGEDTYDDPHLQARDYFEIVDHPEAGTHLLSRVIWRLTNANQPAQRPTATLGEHNENVLIEVLGLAKAAFDKLENDNVIGTMPLPGSDTGGVRRANR